MSDSVSHPAPVLGLNFSRLFKSSTDHISTGATCLEIGAGSGIWSLMCLQRGALVTASDLPTVDLSGLKESARRADQTIDIRSGDLFESVQGQRFDHIFFNPPFHIGEARDERENAYFGGKDGVVVRRYLDDLELYLSQEGIGWLILPALEYEHYEDVLSPWVSQEVDHLWLPLLGTVRLWALTHPHRVGPSLQKRPMNPVSECFLSLSRVMNTHSCEVLTLDGQVDERRLYMALQRVLSQQLLTRSLLVRDRGGVWGGFSWLSQHPTPSPSLTVEHLSEEEEAELLTSLTEDGCWREQMPVTILARVWNRVAIDPQQQVPFEFRLLRGQSISLIMIIAPHLCTDAFAGTLLLNQIAAAYSQAAQASEHVEAFSAVMIDHYQEVDPLETAHPTYKTASNKRLEAVYTWQAVKGICLDFFTAGGGIPATVKHRSNRGDTRLLIKRISTPQLTSVLKGARARGVKAHTLFTWGFSRALKRWLTRNGLKQSNRLRIADLCTLRPLLHEAYRSDIDLLVQPYTYTVKQNWDEEEALREISSSLAYQKTEGVLIDLIRSKIYRLFPRFLPLSWVMGFTFHGLFKTNVTTTNPGPAPLGFSDFGGLKVLDFINFPQIAPPAELGLIYTTYRGELRIVTLYDESRWEEESLRILIDELWQEVLVLAHITDTEGCT